MPESKKCATCDKKFFKKPANSQKVWDEQIKFCSHPCYAISLRGKIPHNKTHGMRETRLYEIWCGIKKRCLNIKHRAYHRYGGRGIKVCEKWLDFLGFVDDMKKSYDEHVASHGTKQTTIDRIDNNGPYTKENCRWATHKEQRRNQSNTRFLTYNGKTQTVMAWSEELGIPYGRLSAREQKGWSDELILTQPLHYRNGKPSKSLTFQGRTQTIREWAIELKVSSRHLRTRKQKGWSDERILTLPIKLRPPRKRT